jgi:hypothetical protein
MEKNKVYYKLYNPAGLFNQVLSLETAVGLQHKTKKDFVIYNASNNLNGFAIFSPSNYSSRYSDMISPQQNIRIDDLFCWNSQDRFVFDDQLNKETLKDINKYDLFKFFLIDKDKETDNVKEFASNRTPLYINEEQINCTKTLVSYSYFFYHRDKDLDAQIRSVSPKKE